jgi:flavin reductase (DIM6/NTAB) family NADH-FMN oxidoreductase RutF
MQKVINKAITHGVYIVTAKAEEKKNGMTAAWISQVSFKPTLVMAAIAPTRYTYSLIKDSSYFAINTLAEDQIRLAKHFGYRSGKDIDKISEIPHFEAGHGSPVLKIALAYVECRLVNSFDAGDHSLFIGEVIEGEILAVDKEPLLFIWENFF